MLRLSQGKCHKTDLSIVGSNPQTHEVNNLPMHVAHTELTNKKNLSFKDFYFTHTRVKLSEITHLVIINQSRAQQPRYQTTILKQKIRKNNV